ncbi:UDP-N-acetylmuramate--L-alanine ligase [Clostridia bacterium]|nr:UDP-N-acetylmuramate--L-alanine ligase [Clostridia bacterium]
MAALAKIYIEKQDIVRGSDMMESPVIERLRKQGAIINIGHNAEHITEDIDYVVVSTAIRENNAEYVRAKEMGIPILHRSQVLQMLTEEKKSVNIAGSHGKTTTSSMLSSLLMQSSIDATCVVGGYMERMQGNGIYGKGKYMVAEADESDGSFLNLHSHIAVVTNIENDHLEHYGNMENMENAFNAFLFATDEPGIAVLGIDCPRVRRLAQGLDKKITFALDEPADYTAKNVHYVKGRQVFDIQYDQEIIATLSIHMPGRHNVLNALCAYICARYIGLESEEISQYFLNYLGVGRRFQLKGKESGVTVVDDYAHHPSEIGSLLRGAREIGFKRIIGLFQPHRYSRTKQLMQEFADVLTLCDIAYVSDIYSAGEESIPGVSSQKLVELCKKNNVTYIGTIEEMAMAAIKEAEPNDLILTIGAGNITEIGDAIVANMQFCHRTGLNAGIKKLVSLNSWHVGGTSAIFLEPKNETELVEISGLVDEKWIILGNGSNVLFSDDLLTRPLVHIGSALSKWKLDGDCMVAQAGISMALLSQKAMLEGLSGLEALSCIPGTLGGAIYMNAGVKDVCIWDLVEQVRVADKGRIHNLSCTEANATYRHTKFMDNTIPTIVLDVRLRMYKDDVSRIEGRMKAAKKMRKTQPSGFSAGSTFKNPPGKSAGQLIEECGLKGYKVGDAQISSEHANFIINLGNASAKDILSLIKICQNRVLEQFGISLETEVLLIDYRI